MKKRLAIVFVLLFAICSSMIAYAASGSTIVYITDTGSKYHRVTCGSLWNSCHAIALESALARGYGACDRCNPPQYVVMYAPSPTPTLSLEERLENAQSGWQPTPTPYNPPAPSTTQSIYERMSTYEKDLTEEEISGIIERAKKIAAKKMQETPTPTQSVAPTSTPTPTKVTPQRSFGAWAFMVVTLLIVLALSVWIVYYVWIAIKVVIDVIRIKRR